MKRPLPERLLPVVLCGILVVVLAGAFGGCSRDAVYSATYLDTFDTVLTITVGASSHDEASAHTAAIHAIVADLHRQLDVHGARSKYENIQGLYALNHADGTAVAVTREVLEILLMGKDYYIRTDGMLNICLGAVTTLWHTARETGALPDPATLTEALAHTDPEALVLDEQGMTATLIDPQVQVDVGAVAKGYAMSKVYEYAIDVGIESLLVNLGGHILAIGCHPDGHPWTVSIRHPDGGTLTTVEVENATLSTAGDYERTFTVDGKAYHHIIHPTTAYPADTHRAVTVILPLDTTCIREADALATALFLLSREDGEALLSDLPDAQALWVNTDGSVETTADWGS